MYFCECVIYNTKCNLLNLTKPVHLHRVQWCCTVLKLRESSRQLCSIDLNVKRKYRPMN